jgi:predicted ABC-type transport system involved in lysophospholipase L1 biosynthesis ATPase subunit
VAFVVRCEDVSVVFGRGDAAVTALRDATVEIGPGETVALAGPSGSGKTTLLQVLGGLVEPSYGTVELAGRPAYVFQEPGLLPSLSALENVAFGTWLARRATGRPGRSPAELLELVGLAHRGQHLPGELSGGEAQRVALARALALGPRLLLCDEPTGQLDADTGGRVLDLLEALQAEEGFALVVSTHDADIAARLSRLLLLEDGRLAGVEVNA